MKRYLHNKSFYHLLTNRMGELTPIGGFEAMAGDTVQIQNSGIIRVSPPQTPVMHPVVVKFYNFFVPNRILDPEDGSFKWEDFITGGEDGTYITPPPQASAVNISKGDVAEYFGLSPGTRTYNKFLMAGYASIWNEYFRDQQLQPKLDVDTYDGSVTPGLASWERDYFTSCRPDELLGPEVTLPLGNLAPVRSPAPPGQTLTILDQNDIQQNMNSATASLSMDSDGPFSGGELYADLSQAGAMNINDLREAMALQRYQEARNMYGARFTEYLRYLGISSSDGRLQRPEMISTGKSVINFSEVLQTSQANEGAPGDDTPLGTLGGHGIAGVRSRRARYFCEEQGHIISLMLVRPKAIYTTGQHKKFNRTTKEEYWQKELQAIGMEEVNNIELMSDHADQTGVFGYNNRYESFKHIPSYISGDFRDTLDSWHLARGLDDIDDNVALNSDFLQCNPSDRIYQDTSTDSDKLWCTIRNRIAVRSMLRKSTQNYIF